jgi:hypothetical protein
MCKDVIPPKFKMNSSLKKHAMRVAIRGGRRASVEPAPPRLPVFLIGIAHRATLK